MGRAYNVGRRERDVRCAYNSPASCSTLTLVPQAIILAAPFHQTGIQMINSLTPSRVPKQAYVPLYVSFIMTKSVPSPSSLKHTLLTFVVLDPDQRLGAARSVFRYA